MTQGNNGPEARDHYRIDDHVELEYRIVPEEEVTTRGEDLIKALALNEAGRFKLLNILQNIDAEIAPIQRSVAAKDMDLAKYLKAIEHKIETLAQLHISKGGENPLKKVNISGGGMSFHTDDDLKEGQFLLMKFILQPTYYGVATLARVMNIGPSEEPDEGKWTVGVQFIDLDEAHEQAITRHVFKRESEIRRKSRNNDSW